MKGQLRGSLLDREWRFVFPEDLSPPSCRESSEMMLILRPLVVQVASSDCQWYFNFNGEDSSFFGSYVPCLFRR